MKRVVVTGMGAITPLGLNVDEFWNGIKEGKHGFGRSPNSMLPNIRRTLQAK